MKKAIDSNEFDMRVYAMVSSEGIDSWNSSRATIDRWCERGHILNYGNKLTVRSTKIYIDGALGSRGATLLQPYSDG